MQAKQLDYTSEVKDAETKADIVDADVHLSE